MLNASNKVMYDTIFQLYARVFDDEGQIKACGRETCKSLITSLQSEFPRIDFGDKKTGFMNVENIKKQVEQIRLL